MKPKLTFSTRFCGGMGNLLYVYGLYRWTVLHSSETDYLVNMAVMTVAVGLLLFHAEASAVAMNRKNAWGLCGLLGPAGWGLLHLLHRPVGEKALPDRVPEASASMSTVGRTAAVVIVFCWLSAVFGLFSDMSSGAKMGTEQQAGNERTGYFNLRQVAEAQVRYKLTDWDNDGEKAFAQFLPHLWTTVDGKAVPVKTGLLPKALAFAIKPEHAIHGYYYIGTCACEKRTSSTSSDKFISPQALLSKIDACFSVIAIPSVYGETGRLAFRTNESGRVYARVMNKKIIPSEFITRTARRGWVEIRNESDLLSFQQKIRKKDSD